MKHLKIGIENLKTIFTFVRTLKTKGLPPALDAVTDHNNPDILTTQVGGKSVHYIYNPDYFDEMIRRPNVFQKPDKYSNLISIFKKTGIFTSGFELWARQKRGLKPFMVKRNLSSYEDSFEQEIDAMVDRWKQAGKTSDIYRDCQDLSISILFKSLFKADITEHRDELKKSISILNGFAVDSLSNPLSHLFNRHFYMSKQTKDAFAFFQDLMEEITKEAKQSPIENDLISKLLEDAGYYDAQTDTEKQDAQLQVYEEIFQLIAAGYESTASALTWMIAELARNPETQDLLRDEVFETLDPKNIDVADLDDLEMQNLFIDEMLRLYPSLHISIPRKAKEDYTTQDGFTFKKGDYVIVPIANIQRDERWFKNPDKFDMGRMTLENRKKRHKNSSIPFFAGAHICSGKQMFMMEAKMTLSKVLSKLEILSNGDMPNRVFQSSTVPSSNFEIQFKPIAARTPSLDNNTRNIRKKAVRKVGQCPFGHG